MNATPNTFADLAHEAQSLLRDAAALHCRSSQFLGRLLQAAEHQPPPAADLAALVLAAESTAVAADGRDIVAFCRAVERWLAFDGRTITARSPAPTKRAKSHRP